MNNVVVSVFILTYNQEAFIAQTIESVLKQKTNFKYQLVIGEDFSTDATRSICEAYQNKNPEKIKLLPSANKNIGLIANYLRTIRACDGKYIAICDGDDYWIDDFKLKKQVDFLEANSEYSIIYTNYLRLFPDGSFKDAVILNTKQQTGFDNLIDNNYIHSVTSLFRNNQIKEPLPEWILNHPYGDWPTYLWTIKNGGKIYFLNEVTAVYRVGIGVSSPIIKVNSKLLKANLNILEDLLNDDSFKRRKAIINDTIIKLKINLMSSFNRERTYLKGFVILFSNLSLKTNRLQLIKLYFYSIYKSLVINNRK
jgi:glycosyltransferase involved in cell wall biosynthesis